MRDHATEPSPELRSAYAPVEREFDDELLPIVEGSLPGALRGTLLRNGPGTMVRFGVRYGHPFDGDGMIVRFAIDGEGVRYRNRWVRTREFLDEEHAGRPLYRSFGTNLPGGLSRNLLRTAFKNAANTSLVRHGGKLLALWEGGLPHLVDEESLDTIGRYDYQGRLANRFAWLERYLTPELPFSAHPKIDPHSGELINFGVFQGSRNRLVTYRVTPEGRMATPAHRSLDYPSFVHDFVITRSWEIFFLSPFAFDPLPTLLGWKSPATALHEEAGRPTRILLIPRGDQGVPVEILARPFFAFHCAGAWEESDGRVMVDVMRMDRLPRPEELAHAIAGESVQGAPPHPLPLLTRYRIDPRGATVDEVTMTDHPAELPRTAVEAGEPHRYVYTVGTVPGEPAPIFHSILKLDTTSAPARVVRCDFGPDLPGEPIFVPFPEGGQEDDGWLLTLVYQAREHRSELVVLDARDLRRVCAARLPHHVPPGFHGIWVARRQSSTEAGPGCSMQGGGPGGPAGSRTPPPPTRGRAWPGGGTTRARSGRGAGEG
jgi:all-trans-8'-apo-beta-carotenal 15,15'-oxygenase